MLASSPDTTDLNRDLEEAMETVEDMSVQLTWMAYDMVALRTSPELGAAMEALQAAYGRCKAAVYGDSHLDPGVDDNSGPAAPTVAEK